MAPCLFWIGLGNMGRGMTRNLAQKGQLDQPLLVFNRSKQRVTDLVESLPSGAVEAVDSIADGVAKADIIFICIADDAAVEETIAAAVAVDVKGKEFVECSTIHPDTTEKVARLVASHGAGFVAAPVFGAPAMAEAGQLICLLAGPRASVDRVRPYFKGVLGRMEIDMSDQPYGKATTLKVLGNTFILNMIEQLAEVHVAAEKTGLGTQYIHALVEGLFGGPYTAYSNRMLTGDYWKREEPLFAVDLARKDMRHALDLAKSAGARLVNTETGYAHLEAVKAHAGEKGDIAGVYGAVREEAGLKFENDG